MAKLLIIVPKVSLLNSYFLKSFRVYAKLSEFEDMVCYKHIGLSNPMETASYLVTMFMLQDFSINCDSDNYTFLVRS